MASAAVLNLEITFIMRITVNEAIENRTLASLTLKQSYISVYMTFYKEEINLHLV